MNIDDSQKALKHQALEMCQRFLGGAWTNIDLSEMLFTPISGGTSNSLFCCALPQSTSQEIDNEPTQVLLRLYGDKLTNAKLANQLKIFKLLSNKNLGPKLYGDFEGGRLEEFLPASPLTPVELRDKQVSAIVARQLAIIHTLDVPIPKNTSWLKDKYDEYIRYINDNLGLVLSLGMHASTRKLSNKILSIDYNEEIRFLSNLFAKSNSPLVFSHNDLHQGNILLTEICKERKTLAERIVFIDYEYSGYNYRAFDIANHFVECCFDYNAPTYPYFTVALENFPSETNQLLFIRHYFSQLSKIRSMKKIPGSGLATNKNASNNATPKANMIDIPAQKDLTEIAMTIEEENLLKEIKPFIMGAHFLWVLWGIKNALSSQIKFGYWEFAVCRWKLYMSIKESYLNDLEVHD